jgi:quinol monooxygenase YgiN
MKTIILNSEVKNYSDWRKVYDADEENRVKAGLHMTGVYQSVDNPNKITLIGEAPSVEAIRSFMANPELKAAMERGGVIGIPDVKILNKI